MLLENEQLRVELSTQGAEIHELYNKSNGLEYMWNGDPAYWTGRNPILFPIVGKTWPDGTYTWQNKTYQMPQHGTVRHSLFTVAGQGSDRVTFEVSSNPETRKMYPFDYRLAVTYILRANRLTMNYVIENTGEQDMPYSFGLHPAFRWPIDPKDQEENYHIELEKPEACALYDWSLGEFRKMDQPVKTITLDRPALNQTIMLKDFHFDWVKFTNGRQSVTVDTKGYPYVAFWTKNERSPFVCIEPWYGIGDQKPNDVPFDQRPGTKILPAGKTDQYTCWIEIA